MKTYLPLLALLLTLGGCNGFKNARVYPMAEIDSKHSHNAWTAGGVNVVTDKHSFDFLAGIDWGISDHRDDKVTMNTWGGVIRWRMK